MNKVVNDLEVLKKVQEVDAELYMAVEQLKLIPHQIAALRGELASEKSHLIELENVLKKLLLKQKEKEGELAQKEMNVKKFDGQLSQVKTNKEYTTLQQEIASLKADNSLLEEDVIRILDEIEAAQEEVQKEKSRLKECEQKCQSVEYEVKAKEKNLIEIRDRLQKQKEGIVIQLQPDVRELYERILAKKEGRALVKMQGQVCSACQMQLRPQMVNEVYLKEKLVVCESCARILYTDEEPQKSS